MNNSPFLQNGFNSPSLYTNNDSCPPFLSTNDGFNSPLIHTSDASNSYLLYTNDACASLLQSNDAYSNFTDDIVASGGILDDFSEQPILENTFDEFNNGQPNSENAFDKFDKENELDFEDETEDAEPKYSLTVNQAFGTWKAVDETDKNLTSQEEMVGTNKGGGNDQNKHSLSTTSHNVESLNSENMVDHAHHENRPRHCGACGQIGHNARTCNLNFSSKDHRENVNQLPLQIVDDNVGVNDHTNNKVRHCGTCGQVGHNARTCNSKSSS
ncbi:13753_t:CDS:2 [Dentiscutata erythropus]|uniref:13753_t:CDS:1 n=1 Tax=Dentiscutata erythropus TaxID=1348616 RepID=A0A9N9FED4_9GLOM|nr:13753_t:CDS:2 [Dentiscutata erythropus]